LLLLLLLWFVHPHTCISSHFTLTIYACLLHFLFRFWLKSGKLIIIYSVAIVAGLFICQLSS